MALVVVPVEGVLCEERSDGELLHYESSIPGKVLFQILSTTTRLLLLATEHDKDRVKTWLSRENFRRYADVHCYPIDTVLTPWEWRLEHIRTLLSVGHHIDFVIDHVPAVVGTCGEMGVDAMLFSPTAAPAVDLSAQSSYRPWYDLVDTIEQRQVLRATRALEVSTSD